MHSLTSTLCLTSRGHTHRFRTALSSTLLLYVANSRNSCNSSGKQQHPPWPYDLASSDLLTHHKSVFQGHASIFPAVLSPSSHATHRLSSERQDDHGASSVSARLENLFTHIREIYPRTKRATHCMYAYQNLAYPPPVPRPNPDRSSSAAFQPTLASSDGGESGSGALLERLLTMSVNGLDVSTLKWKPDVEGGNDRAIVVALVVYRWYGGVKLGSERWKCIGSVAKQALAGLGEMRGEKAVSSAPATKSKGKKRR